MLPPMKLMISLKRGSSIDTAWRRHSRIGGEVEGLRFHLENNVFVGNGLLLPGVLEKLQLNPSVLVEMTTIEPPAPADQSLPQELPRRRGRPPGPR